MKLLVTGGTGYVGSHVAALLIRDGHEVVIIDNLSNSSAQTLERLQQSTGGSAAFYEVDICDGEPLDEIFRREKFDGVLHFAALKDASASVTTPVSYYHTSVAGAITLLIAMRASSVRDLVFSSSATVYGSPTLLPINEGSATTPLSPDGEPKLMSETILRDAVAANGLRVAVLRYFNPCGALTSGGLGEAPRARATNIMPILGEIALGSRAALQVFGNDFDTPDGTCMRDYTHIEDLASGHTAALAALRDPKHSFRVWNLGTVRPTSVLELAAAFEQACGARNRHQIVGRSVGDAPISYAFRRQAPRRARAGLAGPVFTRSDVPGCLELAA